MIHACLSSLLLALAPAAAAATPLTITSIPSDTAFEILDGANRPVANGRTPAVMLNPPSGKYRVIFRRPGCPPLRYVVDPERPTSDVLGNFTLLEQWRALNEEKRQTTALIKQVQVLSQQVGPALLDDLGSAVQKRQNARVLALLNRYGIEVKDLKGGLRNRMPTPTPKPPPATPTPAPAPGTSAFPVSPEAVAEANALPMLEWNEETVEEWVEKVGQLRAEVEKLRTIRGQAHDVQDRYQRMMNELLELSASDADTRRVVEKWEIRRTGTPTPAPK